VRITGGAGFMVLRCRVTLLELEMRKLLTLVAVVLALTMAIPSLAAASEL